MENDRNAIELKLKNIYREAMQYSDDRSLYSGRTGNCLFRLLYCKYFKNGEIDHELEEDVQKIIDEYLVVGSNTLANGKTGINWFYFQMYKWNFIDLEDLNEICFEDSNLSLTSLNMLSIGNYDFLHGSLGIAYYLLERNINPSFFENYFKELNRLCSRRTDGMVGNFNFMDNNIEFDRVNIGLAHGILSILKFCLQCYRNKICRKESYDLAKKITGYMISNQNDSREFSYFSSLVVDGKEKNEVSRLAWCYGDLSIAYVLYQSSLIFKDTGLEKFALEVFDHSMKRVDSDRTFVRDAGICHGAAGIAHIYNKMWHHTRHRSFKNACDFWIDQTLKFDKFSDTVSGYKQYFSPTNTYQSSSGLLEGSSGIGLVLISYLTNDFDWDYCVMLN